jgi:zinc protease
VIIDRPGAVQTEIRVGHLGIPRKSNDFMATDLVARILGGEGANRLHRVLRSERGLTYGASAELEALKRGGQLMAKTSTRSETTTQALRLMVDEFWRVKRGEVEERELTDAKAYMTGNFPLTIETPDDIATHVLNALFYDLPLRELETFRGRVNAVAVEDVTRAAMRYLRPDRLSVVLVGDASSFTERLEKAGFSRFEVVKLSELDLQSADLRKKQ